MLFSNLLFSILRIKVKLFRCITCLYLWKSYWQSLNVFFNIQGLQLLIFFMLDEEFSANLDYGILCFLFVTSPQLIIVFLCVFIISSFVPYSHVSIESIDFILLSPLALNTILLTSSLSTVCFPL